MTLPAHQGWFVPSDRWTGWLLAGYLLIELLREFLGSEGLISSESARALQMFAHLLAGGVIAVIVFQGAFFYRLGRIEKRWRMQLIACVIFAVTGTLAAVAVGDQLQRSAEQLVNMKPVISQEKLGELLSKPEVSPEQKLSLSRYVASSTYIHSGEILEVFDDKGRWSQYRPTNDDMEMRRIAVGLRQGIARPTYAEWVSGLSLLVCLISAIAGYVRAVQFSNRAPNASL